MAGLEIIYVLIIALEENRYQLLATFATRDECRIMERSQSVLAKCFRVHVDSVQDKHATVAAMNRLLR